MPLAVLHAMYTVCLSVGTTAGYRTFHDPLLHRDYCILQFPKMISDPSPFSIIFMLMLSIIELWHGKLQSGATYMAVGARQCQLLGLDKDQAVTWVSPTGKLLGDDPYTGKDLCRALYVMIHIHDFYISGFCRVPCVFQNTIDPILLEDHQSSTYSNGHLSQRKYLVPLLAIGRKIKLFRESGSVLHETRLAIGQELSDWNEMLPSILPATLYQDTGSGASWVAFLYLVYHGLNLQLYGKVFVEVFSAGQTDHPIVQKCLLHTQQITDIIRNVLDKPGALADIPFYFIHAVFASAVYTCAFSHTQPVADISVQQRIVGMVKTFFPVINTQAEILDLLAMSPSVAVSIILAHFA
ncbi:hypothetical protein HDU91_005231 [Kappamyces sp. JEL0680]|nr:hypothetical protein HDU91_005231 [Kappamyces sp. JEL0680]